VIGYDQRFQAEYFAAASAEVLAANGVKVWLTQSNTPTPAISYAVQAKGAAGAINITASHNPPQRLRLQGARRRSAGPFRPPT
jgi:phosphomannomutase